MSTLTERMTRAWLEPHGLNLDEYSPGFRAKAEMGTAAAARVLLAAMHGIDHATLRLAFGDFPGALIGWQAAVRAFAREHGIEPSAEEQQP